jgi:hypothetical protein
MGSIAGQEGMTEDDFWNELETGMRADNSMPEDQKEAIYGMLQSLMEMDFRIQANQDKQMLKTTTIQRFTDISEITSWMESMQALVPLMSEGEVQEPAQLAAMEEIFSGAGMTQYEIDGNYLHVHRKPLDLSIFGEEMQQSMAMVKMFLGNDPYRLVIHLPGKVKDVGHPDAEKLDKRTVALDIPMNDLFDPEKEIDFRIRFKAPKGMR